VAYDFVNRSIELGGFRKEFILSPNQWATCSVVGPLAWQFVPFKKSERSKLPKARGLYAFVLRPSVASIFEHGYLMYIGQTGHGNSRTLYDRFPEYFQDTLLRKRPKLAELMQKWGDYLLFYFIPLQAILDLKAMETGLNDALVPPCVTNDFTPIMRKAVKAFK
jgi:hypothetical protein